MKRFLKILFFAVTLLTIGTVAKCADANSSLLVNKPHITHACTISSMKGNNQQQTHFILLFRNGVDGKGFALNCTSPHSEVTTNAFTKMDVQLNTGLVRYILTFFNCLALPPEFLSTAAFRSPPVTC